MADEPRHLRWSLQDIPFDCVQRSAIADESDWFYLLAGASFVETLSDLYAQNLAEYYQDNQDAKSWLQGQWEHEEVQHGRALRAYVLAVWPDFDWETAYARFVAAYAPLCQTNALGPTPALEMAARCVVETGTASFYTMIQQASPEPVLRELAGRIRADEVLHYKYFFRFFRDYQAREGVSRWRLLRGLWQRIAEADMEDSFLAIRCAYEVRNPGQNFTPADFRAFRKRMAVWIRRHYPFEMAIKMLMKPVSLPPVLQRLLLPLLTRGARRAIT
ncbi:ferritin-like domain-containing protein [Acidithiobacillus sp. IBUN Pt1247-S3]|uniref:ferritin-like domain-containing protein n=1 Tax=Acidithiobacillus sp. IBUN Pt1247-S3 TaxID=3166642 RepID=UPI0034E45323